MIRHLFVTALIAVLAINLFAQDKPADKPAEKPAKKNVLPKGKVHYSEDFEQAVGKEWSSQTLSKTPAGKRGFLGEFSNDKVTLALDKLPKHKYIRLSLDLYIIRSWDGNYIKTIWGEVVGPNVLAIAVQGKSVLMNSSFASIGEYNQKQSYPDDYGVANYAPRTGATENNSLGYIFYKKKMDAVYTMSFVLPHSEDKIKIDFSAETLQAISDESWGLDNVEVTVYEQSPVGKLDADKLKKFWGDLSGDDPAKADKALWTLAGAGNTTEVTKHVTDSLKLTISKVAPPPETKKLIDQLDDDNWQVREKATKALKEMGDKVAGILRLELKETKSAEVRLRLRQILSGMAGELSNANLLHISRAGRLLRILGTREAVEALTAIEKQYPQLKVRRPEKAPGG